jgi:hypothetical protein
VIDLVTELKDDVREVTRETIRKALEQELLLTPHPRTNYTLFSRRQKEVNSEFWPVKNAENKVHYVFDRFLIDIWKSTNFDFS